MHKRKYRILSLILVTVLLLTGVYHDKVAETFLLRSCMENSAICSGLFRTDINDVAACMTEMFNECSGMAQQSIELDPLLYLLCSNHIFLFTGNSFGHLETGQSLWHTSDELVMDYMHQSDGKKRN